MGLTVGLFRNRSLVILNYEIYWSLTRNLGSQLAYQVTVPNFKQTSTIYTFLAISNRKKGFTNVITRTN